MQTIPFLFIIPRFFKKKAKGILLSSRSVPFSVRLLCYLLNHWTKFNQIWCVSYSHGWGAQWYFFWASPLGMGQKVKYHLISITKSISKIFIPNFVCVLRNVEYKTYQTGFLFCYSHDWGMQRQNFFCPAPWGPGEGSKVKYHLISITKSISKIFVPNFVCVQNISDGIFILLPRS